MPHYEYDKDYPFAAFITNLGKYNEGDLVGEWVKVQRGRPGGRMGEVPHHARGDAEGV